MNKRLIQRMTHAQERGQATTEYVLLVSGVAAILFLPWIGGDSVFTLLIRVSEIYLNSYHAVLALPVP